MGTSRGLLLHKDGALCRRPWSHGQRWGATIHGHIAAFEQSLADHWTASALKLRLALKLDVIVSAYLHVHVSAVVLASALQTMGRVLTDWTAAWGSCLFNFRGSAV